MKVWLDGELVEKEDAKISVYDHGVLYGDGVFEGIRIYNGKIFQCDAHVERLFESARRIRLVIPQTKQEIVDAMYATLKANDRTDGYIRLLVTRGVGLLGLNPFNCMTPSVIVISDDIALYPPEMYEHGMAVIIAKTVRCSANMLDPEVKSLNYLNNIRGKIEALDAGVGEAIMLNSDGNVTEGTGDNIFIVEDGKVVTPALSMGILNGITRRVVIELARKMGLEVSEEIITPQRLCVADECFLTGSAAEVIAVTKIDSASIGSGIAGEITRKLLAAFRELTGS